jgi:hypothetical protein
MAESKIRVSIKHSIIDKANTTMLVAVSVAVFIAVFSSFAIKALLDQSFFHQRVISEQKDSLKVLEKNNESATELRKSYVTFATEAINAIGGSAEGDGPRDGDNARIVLDALPAEYDFPAVSSSIEKILVDGGYQISSIGGEEDASQLQSAQTSSSSSSIDPSLISGEATSVTLETSSLSNLAFSNASQAIEIPFPFSIDSSQDSIQQLILTLEKSIRPFSLTSISLEGKSGNLSTSFGLKTYYLPKTALQISTKEVE